jgi:hypothetical protein
MSGPLLKIQYLENPVSSSPTVLAEDLAPGATCEKAEEMARERFPEKKKLHGATGYRIIDTTNDRAVALWAETCG